MKGVILTAVSILCVFGILNLGYYQDWFVARPETYWNEFQKQKDEGDDLVARRTERYGVAYTISMKIMAAIQRKNLAHPVVLFEPNSYYRDSLHIYDKLRAPEPAVFYYYTGIEGVWTNSPNVAKANFFVRISKKGVMLDEIKSPQQLQQILAFYKRYPPIL